MIEVLKQDAEAVQEQAAFEGIVDAIEDAADQLTDEERTKLEGRVTRKPHGTSDQGYRYD